MNEYEIRVMFYMSIDFKTEIEEISKEDTLDELFDTTQELVSEFVGSKFDSSGHPLCECIVAFMDSKLNTKQYTMQDLRKYYKDLKENISAEEYKIYAPKESENIIELEIGTEEIIINKQNNTVISSFKNYNSVHDIVEALLTR